MRPDPTDPTGFTLVELFLAVSIVATSLVFIVSGLANLSRFLGTTRYQTEALALGAGKILEWEEVLKHGDKPVVGSGFFSDHPDYSWQGEMASTGIDESLFRLEIRIFRRGHAEPAAVLGAEAWLYEDTSLWGQV